MSFASRISSVRAAVHSVVSPIIHSVRVGSKPLAHKFWAQSKVAVGRWGVPAAIGATVYTFGVAPETREQAWLAIVGQLDPLFEWHFDRTHGRRKKTILAHYGVNRGGQVLELFPGATGSFGALESIGQPGAELRSYPLIWSGIDVHETHWKAKRLQHAAGHHAGIPVSQLLFQSAGNGKSVLQLLKETPDSSAQHILAMHGLSSLFTLPASTTIAKNALSGPKRPRAELQSILKEVYRILKPGGRFIFLDEGAYPEDSAKRTEQEALDALSLSAWHPAGHTAPIEIAQSLPQAGFSEAHIEQWPHWIDPKNNRKGIRVLRVIEVDGKISLDGMNGVHPLVAGVATKSIHAGGPQPNAMSMLQPEQGNLGNMFTR